MTLSSSPPGAIGAYPCKNRESLLCESNISHFVGPAISKAKWFHSDSAPELQLAGKNLGYSPIPATPYRPQARGKQERLERTLQEDTRVLLSQSGLPDCFWPHAIRYAAFARNIRDRGLDSPSPFRAINRRDFPGKIAPFGAQVSMLPHEPASKLERGKDSIFLGWHVTPGVTWNAKDYFVIPVEEFIEQNYSKIARTQNIDVFAGPFGSPSLH